MVEVVIAGGTTLESELQSVFVATSSIAPEVTSFKVVEIRCNRFFRLMYKIKNSPIVSPTIAKMPIFGL